MALDPVCKMEVNEASAVHKSYFKGQPHYFCSAECKRRFDENPEKYGTIQPGVGTSETIRQTVGSMGSESFRTEQAGQQSTEGIEKIQKQAKSMAVNQKSKAAEGLDRMARALRQTSKNFRQEDQAGVSRYVDQVAEKIEEASQYVRNKDVNELVEDAECFVRSQPALAFGGAFAMGFIVARFLKSSSAMSAHRIYE